jgi:hypothetical protein
MLNLGGVSRMAAQSIVALQQRISSASAMKKRGEAGRQKLSDFRVDFFHDGNGSIKSLQRDVIAGRWDD